MMSHLTCTLPGLNWSDITLWRKGNPSILTHLTHFL
jgi:hypothetical protein